MTIYQAFSDELSKVGFALPALFTDPVHLLASALGGVAIYDILRGTAIPGYVDLGSSKEEGKQVVSKQLVEQLVKNAPLKKPVKVVENDADIEAMIKDLGMIQRLLAASNLRRFSKAILRDKKNAAVVRGKTNDYVIIPEKVGARVVEHEIGHLIDLSRPDYKGPGVLTGLLSAFWKPAHRKAIMEREERAWEHTKKTPLREKALATYERGFHSMRSKLLSQLAGTLMAGGAMEASNAGGIPRS